MRMDLCCDLIFGLCLTDGFCRAAGNENHQVCSHCPCSGRAEGKCWTGSIAAPRPDAWRCMIGNEIVDPCFSSRDRNFVICNPNPPKGYPGFRLRLTEPLPRSETPVQSGYDGGWLVELVDGTLCRPATGASFEVKGKVAGYYCRAGKVARTSSCWGTSIPLSPLGWLKRRRLPRVSEVRFTEIHIK